MPETKLVFVWMPFDNVPKAVYTELIKPAFEEAGFRVLRADDISNHTNILEDNVTSIRAADFILADLTGSNPNVYYELGLADALGKPAVLLSQDVKTAPFDISQYRIHTYGTQFDVFAESKARLSEHAKEIAAGKVLFGSPFSDQTLRAERRQEQGIIQKAPPRAAIDDGDNDGRGTVDWVSAKADWTLDNAFVAVQQQVTVSVDRIKQRHKEEPYKITSHSSGEGFTVSKGTYPWVHYIYFLKKPGLGVTVAVPLGKGDKVETLFTAKPVVTDDGKKMFRVDTAFLDAWQISRKALEDFFFGAH